MVVLAGARVAVKVVARAVAELPVLANATVRAKKSVVLNALKDVNLDARMIA